MSSAHRARRLKCSAAASTSARFPSCGTCGIRSPTWDSQYGTICVMRYRLALLALISLAAIAVPAPRAQQASRDGAARPYLAEAQGAARWLRNVAVPQVTGLGWPAT